MTEGLEHTAQRLGYLSVEEARANHWRQLTAAQRLALAAHHREAIAADEARKRALAARGLVEVDASLVKRAKLGGYLWRYLGRLHSSAA